MSLGLGKALRASSQVELSASLGTWKDLAGAARERSKGGTPSTAPCQLIGHLEVVFGMMFG